MQHEGDANRTKKIWRREWRRCEGKEMLIEEKEMRQRNARVFKSEKGDAREFNCFQTLNNELDVMSYRWFDGLFSFLGGN